VSGRQSGHLQPFRQSAKSGSTRSSPNARRCGRERLYGTIDLGFGQTRRAETAAGAGGPVNVNAAPVSNEWFVQNAA
jgi:hypothetical protein